LTGSHEGHLVTRHAVFFARLLLAIAELRQNRPKQVGLRPKMVFPSLVRRDWDSELRQAGLESLARQAA
jgi:hypothetical protein